MEGGIENETGHVTDTVPGDGPVHKDADEGVKPGDDASVHEPADIEFEALAYVVVDEFVQYGVELGSKAEEG